MVKAFGPLAPSLPGHSVHRPDVDYSSCLASFCIQLPSPSTSNLLLLLPFQALGGIRCLLLPPQGHSLCLVGFLKACPTLLRTATSPMVQVINSSVVNKGH